MRTILLIAAGVVAGAVATAAAGLWLFRDLIVKDDDEMPRN